MLARARFPIWVESFGRNADVEVDGRGGEPDGDRAHDPEREPQRDAPEAAAAGIVELAELRDCRRRGLDSGGQGHGDGEGEQHGDHRGMSAGVGDVTDVRQVRVKAAEKHHDGRAHERERHQGEQRATDVSVPGQTRNPDEQHQGESDPIRSETGDVIDQRRCSRGHADGDGQHEVHDQRADRNERPPFPEGLAGRCGRAASLGEPGDQLVVVRDDHGDDRHDQRHGRQQQPQVAVQRAQGSFDRIGDRGHRIGHHREGEGQQQNGSAAKASPEAPAGQGQSVGSHVTFRAGVGVSPTRLPGTPGQTVGQPRWRALVIAA